MKVLIYTLEDPITNEIRYIGKTKNPKMRFQNHMNKKHNEKSHKTNWIESLKKNGLKPLMVILDEVEEDNWIYWERFWIQQFKVWGFNLVNHTSGGDGLTFENQTSFKKGNSSWNKGTGVVFDYVCKICSKNYKSSFNNRKFCSNECHGLFNSITPNSGVFNDNHIPWNKGKSGYRLNGLKKAIPVLQFDLDGNFIKEFYSCKDASNEMGCIEENIRRACVGKSKTAMKFKWKYKND